VLASRNAHKLQELEALLAPHELRALPAEVELPPETSSTFAANALGKARAAASATGEPSLGEDSGIVVEALGGDPGIRSARYAGEGASDDENLHKLLRETEQASDRGAAYVCALALVVPEGEEALFEGRCEGRLARTPRGRGGFGYDPIFIPAGGPRASDTGSRRASDGGVTMAELTAERKNEISHRGRAASMLRDWLASR